MALIVSQAQVNTTPDQGGTTAVASPSNTGHGSTTSAATATGVAPGGADLDSESKSCRWSSFTVIAGAIKTVQLKLNWTASGSCSADPGGDGAANGAASFAIEYTVNGGGAWLSIASGSILETNGSDSFTNNNSADIALGAAVDISQVQVRNILTATTAATGGSALDAQADAQATVTISGIQLEVTTQDGPVITLM